MKSWKIFPRSPLGWWAVVLILAMPCLFVVGSSFASTSYRSIPAGKTIAEDLLARPALALSMLAGMVSGITAFIVGLLAIIRKSDMAVLVVIAMAVGALLILFLVAELVFPH